MLGFMVKHNMLDDEAGSQVTDASTSIRVENSGAKK